MDRRSFMYAALAVTAAPSALAQSHAAPAARPAAPEFPPVDARTVWLVGDGPPGDPTAFAPRLAALVQAHQGPARDTYLGGGAVAELEAAFAALLGKEDAAFFPTGTLANNVALRMLCGEHPHALVQHESHLYRDESDTPARLGGITLVPLAAGRTSPTLEEVSTAIDEAEKGPYPLKVGAIALESPVRRTNGALVPLETVAAIAKLARAHGAGLHLDAARLLLAPPSVDVKAYAAHFDTVYVSLYKYLGAPFGAVLAGTKAQVAQARELRHLYGGLIAQGWMAALVALDSLRGFSERMAAAHAAAARLLQALEAKGKVRRRPEPNPSNIHLLEMSEAQAQAAFERCRQAGVRLAHWSEGAVPLYVNETLTRRPVEEYVKLLLG
ncbi:low specificity L-threonine aldolase [Aggregicoccus sp. 17bor-14]|uniref:threonine aldolase family protein n=1 Tax=Myxococcaceae TaxID=31 RepID=UPI00129C857F|nr:MULTISPECIES: aminotransferase class I/II-fold pyridoxal phosphate-dependent enzyme [Myxococcaceae]MBF5041575.1 aminotransferase class I/II-fold pyridoxal phosphate-dependent enzyme [Simulacricoccus sp. 17bor-14]MRI87361.1 low specificity L-threonine aldolase [Aggregicoccus sp. 17bor-14]